ncbi:39S ribosomal protein L17, mitochondrial [Rhipicephalus sanguineus]|uniref:39S ribosomal protein L17, mitochondrial n=1 Tax=Rhipicephalus sanguineus TaxID=34632 RepID=UPI0018952AAB|nr:39S ribosomal protein L17, mitochondrial [Rhipicephalus sanguineus]
MADATRLIPALKHVVTHRHRRLTTPKGSLGRVEKIRATLTALFKHERIELNHPRADEVRGYAERLISEAIRYGDCHARTMELADYWINEKQLVHKLFKVLAPRFATYEGSYTRVHILPTPFNDKFNSMEPGPYYKHNWVALELKGNPYPPMPGAVPRNPNFLPNLLLSEARKDIHRMQFPEKVAPAPPPELGTSLVTKRSSLRTVIPPGGTPPAK